MAVELDKWLIQQSYSSRSHSRWSIFFRKGSSKMFLRRVYSLTSSRLSLPRQLEWPRPVPSPVSSSWKKIRTDSIQDKFSRVSLRRDWIANATEVALYSRTRSPAENCVSPFMRCSQSSPRQTSHRLMRYVEQARWGVLSCRSLTCPLEQRAPL